MHLLEAQDFVVLGLLVFLEGVLSIDNALVLALLARPLSKPLQKKALTYGLVGAVIFRLVAVLLAGHLMRWRWVKFVGGGYLLLLAYQHFFSTNKGHEKSVKARGFWATVLVIELTDIAFAVDSILAAIAMTPKLWLIFTGGILGVILMRFAASQFIHLLEKFPRFENTAFLLVFVIGVKVIIEGLQVPGIDFHDSGNPSFWIFWGLMAAAFGYGFVPKKAKKEPLP